MTVVYKIAIIMVTASIALYGIILLADRLKARGRKTEIAGYQIPEYQQEDYKLPEYQQNLDHFFCVARRRMEHPHEGGIFTCSHEEMMSYMRDAAESGYTVRVNPAWEKNCWKPIQARK